MAAEILPLPLAAARVALASMRPRRMAAEIVLYGAAGSVNLPLQ